MNRVKSFIKFLSGHDRWRKRSHHIFYLRKPSVVKPENIGSLDRCSFVSLGFASADQFFPVILGVHFLIGYLYVGIFLLIGGNQRIHYLLFLPKTPINQTDRLIAWF